MKSLELSTIFTVAPPFTVSWIPSSVGREFLMIFSVPSGWTSTATVPGFTLVTGISTLVSPALLGTSMFTTGAVLEFRVASTSTGAFTGSPSFLVSVWILVPSGLVVVSTFPVLPELSRSEDEPPPEEDPPEDWA